MKNSRGNGSAVLLMLMVIAAMVARPLQDIDFNNPHVPAGSGPWYEGWYTRIADGASGRSVAVLGVSNLAQGVAYTPGMYMPGYILVVIGEGSGGATRSFEAFPDEVTVTCNGKPVEHNMASSAPADFQWLAPGYGSITQDRIDITIPGAVTVHATMGERLPWNAKHPELGPEGALTYLPLPLHWYVSSIGSPCTFEYTVAGEHAVAGSGLAHCEKNWGSMYPATRTWGQGSADGGRSQIVWGGGRVTLGSATLDLTLAGYRSPQLRWDFNPFMPGTKIEAHGTADDGSFSLKASDATRTLTVEALAPAASFAAVSVPTPAGWVTDCGGESFSATILVTAYLHEPLGSLLGWERQIESRVFTNAALEFGGAQ